MAPGAGWPVSHFVATAVDATQTAATPRAAAPPVTPGENAAAVPAGGISFAGAIERPDPNGEHGPSS